MPAPTPEPVPEEPYIVQGEIIDGEFDSVSAARDYAESVWGEKTLPDGSYVNGYGWEQVVYSDGTVKYTIYWY